MLNTLADLRAETLGRAYDAGFPAVLLVDITHLPMLWRRARYSGRITRPLRNPAYSLYCLDAEAQYWLA